MRNFKAMISEDKVSVYRKIFNKDELIYIVNYSNTKNNFNSIQLYNMYDIFNMPYIELDIKVNKNILCKMVDNEVVYIDGEYIKIFYYDKLYNAYKRLFGEDNECTFIVNLDYVKICYSREEIIFEGMSNLGENITQTFSINIFKDIIDLNILYKNINRLGFDLSDIDEFKMKVSTKIEDNVNIHDSIFTSYIGNNPIYLYNIFKQYKFVTSIKYNFIK